MARTGILIEIEKGMVKETSLGVMTAAKGHEIYALVPGAHAASVKDRLAGYGASRIVGIPGLETAGPDLQAEIIVAAVKEYGFEALLGTAGATGKDLFARISAILDEPLAADCLGIDIAGKTVKKSHFSGKTLATLRINSPILICTLRPNSIEPEKAAALGELMEFKTAVADPGLIKITEIKKAGEGKPDLAEASVVITGGRGIKSAENYQMLEACARKIGAAVGASRAAVDAGYAPHSMQVGQTGKTVSPKLYIACGVSGAVQHFAGMKTSKVIVAINEDKDAPIFGKCDYGIVGDMFKIIPVLTEKL